MTDRRPLPAVTGLAAAALLALLALAVPTAAAAAESIYDVGGVEVDVTAASAAAAREQALAEGEAKAFDMLLDRIVFDQDRGRLPALSRQDISRFVRDFSVTQEKTSSVRYLATLSYRFRPEPVRRLLIDSGVAFTETPSKPVLVLPVYRSAGALFLWDDPNPWLAAWRQLPPQTGLVPLVLPLGDLTDIAAVGAEQAARGDLASLSAAARRYGASDALVAVATVTGAGAGGGTRAEVNVTRYGSSFDGQTMVLTYTATPGEELQALLTRAADQLAQEIQSAWKRDNRIAVGQSAVLAVTVPVASLDDWLGIRRRLARVAVIQDVELVLLSRSEVRVNLHYAGAPDQLATALAQADLNLREGEGETTLQLAGAAVPGAGGAGTRP